MPKKVNTQKIIDALNNNMTYDDIINAGLCGSKSTISRIRKEFLPIKSTVQKSSTVQKTKKSIPGIQLDLDRFIVQGLASAPITLKAKMALYLSTGALRNLSLKELASKIVEFWNAYT